MKLAISNIAWPAARDAEIAQVLRAQGVHGVEVAPTKWWPDPLAVTAAEIRATRTRWEDLGLPIIAAQALLFGREDLKLFADDATRARTLEYLSGICRLCGQLGAEALVFGAPRNRRVGNLDRAIAWRVALEFFGALATAAERAGTVIVIEANPAEYHADFITRAGEAIDLVRAVARPGLLLHLDSACMTMAGDDVNATIAAGAPALRHFHASEPQLAPVCNGIVNHRAFAQALRRAGYTRWVSIEMREPDPFDPDILVASIQHVRQAYGL